MSPAAGAYGTRVRWARGSCMHTWKPDSVGTIVPQPIGSTGNPPEGGTYVLWKELREPMACFVNELEVVS